MYRTGNILAAWLLIVCAAMPVHAQAKEAKAAASVQTQARFLPLPPRQHHGAVRAKRGQLTSLKAIARQQPRGILRPKTLSDALPPLASDKHKLLLYVYDEMH